MLEGEDGGGACAVVCSGFCWGLGLAANPLGRNPRAQAPRKHLGELDTIGQPQRPCLHSHTSPAGPCPQVDEEELLLARLDAGLFTLQQCCVVFGNLWATGDVGLRRRLLGALHQKGQTLAPVR